MEPLRLFDLDDANAALEQVRPLVARIAELSAALPDLQDGLGVARYLAHREGNDDGVAAPAQALEDAQREMVETAGRLRELGVMLKDPRAGLIDFPSEREGEVVELCWRLGEDRVRYWHRVGEGYPGRKAL